MKKNQDIDLKHVFVPNFNAIANPHINRPLIVTNGKGIKMETGATGSIPWRRLPTGIDLMLIIKPAGLEAIFGMVIKKAGPTV